MQVDLTKYNPDYRFVEEQSMISDDCSLYIFKFVYNRNHYRNAMHYNSFFYGYNKSGIQVNWTDRRLFSVKRFDEIRIYNEIFKKSGYIKEYNNIVEVESIRDFFNLIGYDYKTKKYNTGEYCKFTIFDEDGRILKSGYKIPRKKKLTANAISD